MRQNHRKAGRLERLQKPMRTSLQDPACRTSPILPFDIDSTTPIPSYYFPPSISTAAMKSLVSPLLGRLGRLGRRLPLLSRPPGDGQRGFSDGGSCGIRGRLVDGIVMQYSTVSEKLSQLIPSGKRSHSMENHKITISKANTEYKWPFSVAILKMYILVP